MRLILLWLLFAGSCAVGERAPAALFPGRVQAAEGMEIPPGLSWVRPRAFALPELSGTRRGRQIGMGRPVPLEAARSGVFTSLADGRWVWRMVLEAPGAAGLRVRFRGFDGGALGKLWVYAGPRLEGPFVGRGVFGDGEIWTGAIEGASVVIEYASSGRSVIPFSIDRVVELWPGRDARSEADAASCDLDVACYAAYSQVATGVELFEFLSDGGGYFLCSGSMISTESLSFKPYFLTANHCVGSEAEARSMVVVFGYQNATCNGSPPAVPDLPHIVGGSFVTGAGVAAGDYSLVLLAGDAPAGTMFLGWNTGELAQGDPVVGIDHPQGSWTRISFGSRTNDLDTPLGNVTAPASLYYRVRWDQGKTESGSSGSPLLNANNEIVGTLTYGPELGGEAICNINPEVAGYGRFSVAYPALKAYLMDGAPLTVSPGALSFLVQDGQIAGSAQATLSITTASPVGVPFTLSASDGWMMLSASRGTATATMPAQIVVSLDASYFVSHFASYYTRASTVQGVIMLASGNAVLGSVAVSVQVTVSASHVSVEVNPSPVYETTGGDWFYEVTLRETGGIPAHVSVLTIGGLDQSANIVPWFGSDSIGANGALRASLRAGVAEAPANRVIEADGVDSAGEAWSARATVQLLPRPAHAVLSLDSSPRLIRQNPGSPECPWYQQLVLRESGGYSGSVAGGPFDGKSIAANGTLIAGMCWTGIQAPDTRPVRVAMLDTGGSSVVADVTGSFAGPAEPPVVASASAKSLVLSASAPAATLALNLSSGSSTWRGRLIFPDGLNTGWLRMSPLAGVGPATLTVTADRGIAAGVYTATLVIESDDAVPELIAIPVTFTN